MVSVADYQAIVEQARQAIERGGDPAKTFGALTDVITRGRANLIKQVLLDGGKNAIRNGPFAGMLFHESVSEGCYVPKLLGCYEAELHPVIALLPERNYRRVVDIGCAEGYYAVGLARLLPGVEVLAHDIDPKAREMTARLAATNDVSSRVRIGGELDHAALATAIIDRSLVFCDIEGAEYALLDVNSVPALASADLIVELHGVQRNPGRTRAWIDSMRGTHEATIVGQGARNPSVVSELAGWKHLDQLLAIWEFRGEPTPWAWLRSKVSGAGECDECHL